MRDEFAFHIESRVDDLLTQGVSPDDARRRAMLDLGGLEVTKELARDTRRLQRLDDLARDVGYAWRTLRNSPGLVLTGTLSLGIGIGVNAAVFAVLRSIIFYQPTASAPERLVGVEPGDSRQLSYPHYRELQDGAIFNRVAAYRIVRANLRVDAAGEPTTAAVVSGNFFETLGIHPQAGRTFTVEESAPEREPRVAVISHALWRRRFSGDASVIGRTVYVNGAAVSIVGILPAGYRAVVPIRPPDVYVPINELLLPGLRRPENVNALTIVARLRDDDTPARAQLAVTGSWNRVEQRATVFPFSQLALRGAPPEVLWLPAVLLALFGMPLLIACGNMAGLLLARATSRHHEITVRLALGASRMRLMQTLLAEAFVLGSASAVGGVLLTLAVLPLLDRLSPGTAPLQVAASIDGWLFVYAVVAAAATTIACGLVPALRATRTSVSSALHESAVSATGSMRLRNLFVAGQATLSALLLIVSALLLRTATRAAALDPGFDVATGVVARVALDNGSPADRIALARALTVRLQSLPDVQSVSVANIVPLAGDVARRGVDIRGRAPDGQSTTLVNNVGPQYFETMGIALRGGREFQWSDSIGAPLVAIVNQTFARRYFGNAPALGRSIRTNDDAYAEIVGVAADTKFASLTETPEPLVYYSYAQRPGNLVVHVRPLPMREISLRTLRTAVEAVDARALVSVEALRETAGFEIAFRKNAGLLLAALGGIGLILALVGLYGVMAYTVVAQRAEIGVRMALGAPASAVLWLIVGRGVRVTAVGLCAGVLISLPLTVSFRSLLAGVSPVDPAAVAATALLLLAGGAAASWLPALHATRIDPVAALKQQ